MFNFPDTEKKLKSRISNYTSAMNKEKREYGYINDSGGKRYLLFCLYFVLDDLVKSDQYFEWYKDEFPDDSGEPIQKLCWSLVLHRMGKDEEAKYRLGKLMLSNLYIIPQIIGKKVDEYDIWHSSNYQYVDYFEYIPEEIAKRISPSEVAWMLSLYDSFEFRRIRKRYIEIYHEIQGLKDIEARKKLLNESYSLLDSIKHASS